MIHVCVYSWLVATLASERILTYWGCWQELEHGAFPAEGMQITAVF